jgi:ABC-type sugar transport system ATPase subunit
MKVRGARRAERLARAREAAELLGIGELLERRPAQLSGGQRQRVAMARAIARSPAVYLFDEPLSNLDAALRGEIRTLLAQLRDRLRTTTVYVTHDQVEAMTLGDRVAVMLDGRVSQCGPPAEVFARPANRFVAGFLGAPPMNFAELDVRDGAVELLGARVPLRARTNGRVVVGIRPTDLRPAGESRDGGAVGLRAVPRVVEAMGTATDAAFDAPDAAPDASLALPLWKARLGKDVPVERGSPVALELRPDDLHLFDPVTGERC